MDALATALLCDEVGVARPRLRRIGPRKVEAVFHEKPHLALVADPSALRDTKDSRFRLQLEGTQKGELRCPRCGTRHKNASLALLYRSCHHCDMVLREPDDVEVTAAQQSKLHVLAASYGHPVDASLAVDVTAALQAAVAKTKHTRLKVTTEDDLRRVLWGSSDATQRDPCPRERKVVKVRYAIHGVRGELSAEEGAFPFHLAKDLNLLATSRRPLVSIVSAFYGHPLGAIDGRGAFDVRDVLQYRVDSTNGRYCAISHREDLRKLFGEPCGGRSKHLVVEYEIAGKRGELYEYEIGGKLAKDISVVAAPSLAPQIIIEKATYGWTAASARDHVKSAKKAQFELQRLEQRRKRGLALTADETKRLRTQGAEVERMLGLLDKKDVALGSVDVTDILQRRIELADGALLFVGGLSSSSSFGKDHQRRTKPPEWVRMALHGKECVGLDVRQVDDLNTLFGDPLPGIPVKLLRIEYAIVGHDADRRASAPEITSSGIEANFVRTRPRVLLDTLAFEEEEEEEEERGNGRAAHIADSIVIGFPTTLPCVDITYASWGNAADSTQVWDVTAAVKKITNASAGRRIHIPAGADLVRLFGDPCLGTRKKLHIKYIARGFRGCCRVEERPVNHLRTDVLLGFTDDKTDPFNPVPRRSYRDEAIERSMRLRIPPDSKLLEESPYAHLARGVL